MTTRVRLPVAAVAAALLAAACGPSPTGKAAAPGAPGAAASGPPPAMPVTVRRVSPQPVPVLIEAVGQAEGSREIEVRARVTGLVERQLYAEGERIATGAPMFAIERAPFEIALAQAKASLASEQARSEQARRESQRLKPLAEMQAISQREADDAASTLRLSDASLAVAQARVREAELNLSYTNVAAPIGGVSGRAEKSVGALVTPTDGLLARITQTDPIWVRFAFSETEYAQLRGGPSNRGGPVRLLGPDGAPSAQIGRLNFAASVVDARLGTVQLRAEFPNRDLAVLPGQFVRAQVQAGQEQAFLVPQSAVTSSDQGRSVWTVVGGKAAAVPVQVGGWVGADWVVRSGLKAGDQVIVDNLLKLRPGAAVQPRPERSAAAASAADPAASR